MVITVDEASDQVLTVQRSLGDEVQTSGDRGDWVWGQGFTFQSRRRGTASPAFGGDAHAAAGDDRQPHLQPTELVGSNDATGKIVLTDLSPALGLEVEIQTNDPAVTVPGVVNQIVTREELRSVVFPDGMGGQLLYAELILAGMLGVRAKVHLVAFECASQSI